MLPIRRMVLQGAHGWRQHGTRAAGGGWRLAALVASVAYLTLNVHDYVRHMELMPYSGEMTTVPPSAVVQSVERGDRVYISVSRFLCTHWLVMQIRSHRTKDWSHLCGPQSRP